jgi:two-component system, LytTR family, sensor kinase
MSKAWYSKKWVITLLHIVVWVVLFSMPYLLRPSWGENRPINKNNTEPVLVHLRYALNNIIYIIFFYINANILLPRYILKGRYKQYGLVAVGCFLFIMFMTWLTLYILLNDHHFYLRGHLLFNLFFFLFILGGSLAYGMIKERAREERVSREKETENLKTELSLLRSQASPHFMFNVLNNMVALARKKSDLLEPSLMKFSSLMRYMLYEADEEKVALEKEIDYLQSYIDLQQQRFGKNVQVNVQMEKPAMHYEIEPMLLIPFVENAFKHGTGIIENAQIDIILQATEGKLHFKVSNKFVPGSVEVKDKTSGIGLSNVKRRLQLLYDNKHQLQITKQADWFTITLDLKLH